MSPYTTRHPTYLTVFVKGVNEQLASADVSKMENVSSNWINM